MKKIMIALAAVAMAIGAQAATANWKISAASIYNGTGSTATDAKYSGTAYIFDAGITDQAALYAAILVGSEIDSVNGFITTATVSSGSLAATSFSYGNQSTAEQTNNYQFYFALVEDGQMYLSKTLAKDANGTDNAVTVGFGTQNPTTGAKSSSLPTATYEGVGQWAQTVPEPTSGLLLLLGMAGLALKRKQA